MDKWTGRVAVVTGASAGIGAAIAIALARHGVTVAGLARRKDRVAELAAKNASLKGKIHAVECDLTDSASIGAAFDWIEKHLGGVDILVNNAGLFKVGQVFDLTKPEENYLVTINTNLSGLLLATRRAFKTMQSKPAGYIVNINSVAGQYSPSDAGAKMGFNVYGATKHAVRQLTGHMKLELGLLQKNIRITSISPGAVKTEIADASGIVGGKEFFSKVPALNPEDIANQVVHVLSTPENVLITELTIEPKGQTSNFTDALK